MRIYPSKLLLFGEHVLLLGSSALAMPMTVYGGKWLENGGRPDLHLQQKLLQFAQSEVLKQMEILDTHTFCQDIQNGLVFASDIPIGYGLGSSGAVCAGVYDRYSSNKINDLAALKSVFATMESYFHGVSSGIDPLTSYIGKPLLIRHKTEASIAEISLWIQPPVVFLIDSLLPRQTGPLVHWFLERSMKTAFSDRLKSDYLVYHEALVLSWMAADANAFWPNLQRVSQFQLDNFEPMIPATLQDIWMESIESQQITFKICGAGGGGFMLGFSRTYNAVEALAEKFNIVLPFTTPS